MGHESSSIAERPDSVNDDLVKTLRLAADVHWNGMRLLLKAADQIERLQEKVRDWVPPIRSAEEFNEWCKRQAAEEQARPMPHLEEILKNLPPHLTGGP
jgi:hypothetical protein